MFKRKADTVLKVTEPVQLMDFLIAKMGGMARSSVKQLLGQRRVKVGAGIQTRHDYELKTGDIVTVSSGRGNSQLTHPKLKIVYEDDDLIVVNKARGMVVHPAPGHPDSTLVNALLFHCGDSLSGVGGCRRPGIVHRIDKDTSGLLVAAKTDLAHQGLSAQLGDHSLFREYAAVCCGSFRADEGTVDRPIGRCPSDRKRMAVTEKGGRAAVTHWQVLARYRGYCLVRCRLETGRTHQIRVHMASIGHPLLGDGLYGAKCPDRGLEGQCLHARRLTFTHPRSGERLQFEAPLPDYFLEVLSRLGPEQ